MTISSHDLKVFQSVIQKGSMSAAASTNHLTQPAVTAIIKKLEDWAGGPLLIRSNRGVLMTASGKKFYQASHRLMEEWQSLKESIKEDAEAIRGTFRLGVHPSLARICLPQFLPKLLSTYDDLNLELEHQLSRSVSEAVIKCEIDFGLAVNPPKHPDLVITKLYTSEFGFWVKKEPEDLQDPLKETSVIVCHTDLLQTQSLLKKARKKKLLKAQRMISTHDMELILNLVRCGSGIGILPDGVARHYDKELLSLETFPRERDTICLIHRYDMLNSKAAHTIKDAIVLSCKR